MEENIKSCPNNIISTKKDELIIAGLIKSGNTKIKARI
jgi:hypothetical protein